MTLTASFRKISATALSLIYFQVNVVFAGSVVPESLNRGPSVLASILKTLDSGFRRNDLDRVHIFHGYEEEQARLAALQQLQLQNQNTARPDAGETREQPSISNELGQYQNVGENPSNLKNNDIKETVKGLMNLPTTNVPNLDLTDGATSNEKQDLISALKSADRKISFFENRSTGKVEMMIKAGNFSATLTLNASGGRVTASMVSNVTNNIQNQQRSVQPITPRPAVETPTKKEINIMDNLDKNLPMLGFNEGNSTLISGSAKADPVKGAKIITDEKGTRFEGKITWFTTTGFKYEVTAGENGRAERKVTALKDNAVLQEKVGPVVVAETKFAKANDNLTMVGKQVIAFDASGETGITRENFLPKTKSEGTEQIPSQQINLAASRGEFKERYSNLDTTYRMINHEAVAVKIENNVSGEIVASRNSDGQMVGRNFEGNVLLAISSGLIQKDQSGNLSATIKVGNQEVKVGLVIRDNTFVPVTYNDKPITEATAARMPFVRQVTDVEGRSHNVNFNIHHLAFDASGQLNIHGLQSTPAGVTFKAGNLNQAGSAGITSDTTPGGHDYDVKIKSNGDIQFTGRAGGQIPFTENFDALQKGKSEGPSYNALSAGSYNVTLSNAQGTVLASAGALQKFQHDDSSTYSFTQWTINPSQSTLTKQDQGLLDRFHISDDRSALMDKNGTSVAVVSLNQGKVAQVEGLPTEAGRTAMKDIAFGGDDRRWNEMQDKTIAKGQNESGQSRFNETRASSAALNLETGAVRMNMTTSLNINETGKWSVEWSKQGQAVSMAGDAKMGAILVSNFSELSNVSMAKGQMMAEQAGVGGNLFKETEVMGFSKNFQSNATQILLNTKLDQTYFNQSHTGSWSVTWTPGQNAEGKAIAHSTLDVDAGMAFRLFGTETLTAYMRSETKFNEALKGAGIGFQSENAKFKGMRVEDNGTTFIHMEAGNLGTWSTVVSGQRDLYTGNNVLGHQVSEKLLNNIIGSSGMQRLNNGAEAAMPRSRIDLSNAQAFVHPSGAMDVTVKDKAGDYEIGFEVKAAGSTIPEVKAGLVRHIETGNVLNKFEGKSFSDVKHDLQTLSEIKNSADFSTKGGERLTQFLNANNYGGAVLNVSPELRVQVQRGDSNSLGLTYVNPMRQVQVSADKEVAVSAVKDVLTQKIGSVPEAMALLDAKNSGREGMHNLSYVSATGSNVTVFKGDQYGNHLYMENGRLSQLGTGVIDRIKEEKVSGLKGRLFTRELNEEAVQINPNVQHQLKSLGIIGSKTFVAADGSSYSAESGLNVDNKEVVVYQKEGVWVDGSTGEAADVGMIREHTKLASFLPGSDQITNFQDGQRTFIAQVAGGKNAQRVMGSLDASRPLNESQWKKFVGKENNVLSSVVLFNQKDLMNIRGLSGNVVMAPGQKEVVQSIYQISSNDYLNNETKIVSKVREAGAGVIDVAAGSFEGQSFRQQLTIGSMGSEGLRVARYDNDGNHVAATVNWSVADHSFTDTIISLGKSALALTGFASGLDSTRLDSPYGSTLQEVQSKLGEMAKNFDATRSELSGHAENNYVDAAIALGKSFFAKNYEVVKQIHAIDRNGNGVMLDFYGTTLKHEIGYRFAQGKTEGGYITEVATGDNNLWTTVKTFVDESGKNVKQEITNEKGFVTESRWSDSKNEWYQTRILDTNNERLTIAGIPLLGFRESDASTVMAGIAFIGALALAPFTGGLSAVGAFVFAGGAAAGTYSAMENVSRDGDLGANMALMGISFVPVSAMAVTKTTSGLRAGAMVVRAGETAANFARVPGQILAAANLAHDGYRKFILDDKEVGWGTIILDVVGAGLPYISRYGEWFKGAGTLTAGEQVLRGGVAVLLASAGAAVGAIDAARQGKDITQGALMGAAIGLIASVAPSAIWTDGGAIGARLMSMRGWEQAVVTMAGPGLASLFIYVAMTKEPTLEGALAAFTAGAVLGGAIRLVVGQLKNLRAFADVTGPQIYYKMAGESAMGWASFGFLGVGSLLPTYDFGHIDQTSGNYVQGNGWSWNPSRMFTMSLAERFGEALMMFKQGLTLGPLLSSTSYQPTGALAKKFTENHISGVWADLSGWTKLANTKNLSWTELATNMARSIEMGYAGGLMVGFIREISSPSNNGKIDWSNVLFYGNVGALGGLAAGALARIPGTMLKAGEKGTYEFSYSKAVNRYFTNLNIKSYLKSGTMIFNQADMRLITTALSGFEGVIPFHVLTQLGTAIGFNAGLAFGFGVNTAMEMASAFGNLLMFFAPMQDFARTYVTQAVELKNVGLIGDIIKTAAEKRSPTDIQEGKLGEVTLGKKLQIKMTVDDNLLDLARIQSVELIKDHPEVFQTVNNFKGTEVKKLSEINTALVDHPLADLTISHEIQLKVEPAIYNHLVELGYKAETIATSDNIGGFDISAGLKGRAVADIFKAATMDRIKVQLANWAVSGVLAFQAVMGNGQISLMPKSRPLSADQKVVNVEAKTIIEMAQNELVNRVATLTKENKETLLVEASHEIRNILMKDKTLTADQRAYFENRLEALEQGDLLATNPILMTMYVQKNFSGFADHLTQAALKERGVRMEISDHRNDVTDRVNRIADMKVDASKNFERIIDLLTGRALDSTDSAELLLAAQNGDAKRVEKILGENGAPGLATELIDLVMSEHFEKLGLAVSDNATFMTPGKDQQGKKSSGKLVVIPGGLIDSALKEMNAAGLKDLVSDKFVQGNKNLLLELIAKKAYGESKPTFEQAFVLSLLANRVFYENATGSKAVQAASQNWDGSKAVGQVAFELNGLAGRISSLSTGAGKSAGFGIVFGILNLQGKLNVGEYLVALRQDAGSFIRDYQELGHAFGIEFINGSEKYYAHDWKSLIDSYNSTNQGKVVVMDLDARGFTELEARSSGNTQLDQALNKVNVRGVDESDVAALSQKAFRMAHASDGADGFASKELTRAVADVIDSVKDLLKEYKNPREAYSVVGGKQVSVTKDFYQKLIDAKIITPEEGRGTEKEAMVANVLRAINGIETQGETGAYYDEAGKKNQHASIEYGVVMIGTKDGSNFFNVAISLVKMQAITGAEKVIKLIDGASKTDRAKLAAEGMDPNKIEISVSLGEATLSRIFSRRPNGNGDILNFGGSATLDVAKEIANMIYGSEAVELQGSSISEYGLRGKGFQKHLDIENFNATKMESKMISLYNKGSNGVLFIDASASRRVQNLFFALKEAYALKADGAQYKGATGREAVKKWWEANNQSFKEKGLTEDIILEIFAKEVLNIDLNDKSLSLKGAKDKAPEELEAIMINRANNLKVDVINQFTDPVAVSNMASFSAGRIIVANERAGRALNFSNSRVVDIKRNFTGTLPESQGSYKYSDRLENDGSKSLLKEKKGIVNLIVAGYEGMTIGELLQTLGRVGRSSESKTVAERWVYVEKSKLDEKMSRALDLDANLKLVSENKRSLFGQKTDKSLQETLDARREDAKLPESERQGRTGNAELRELVHLVSEFNAAQAKSWSVEFKIGTETHNILIKDPLAALISLAKNEGVSGSVDSDITFLEKESQRILEGSEKSQLKPATDLRDPVNMAREQFKGTLQDAWELWGKLKAQLTNPSLQKMAEARFNDVDSVLKNYEGQFNKALDEARNGTNVEGEKDVTFADVKSGTGAAAELLKIVAKMTDLLIPSEGVVTSQATVRTAPKTISEFEASAKGRTRGSPEETSKAAAQASHLAQKIKNDSSLTKSDGTLTYKGRVVAASVLLASNWNDSDKKNILNALSRLGLSDAVELEMHYTEPFLFSTTLVKSLSKDFYSGNYGQINLNQILNIALDLDQVLVPGVVLDRQSVSKIITSDKPYEQVERFITNPTNQTKINPDLDVTAFSQRVRLADRQKAKEENFYFKNVVNLADGNIRFKNIQNLVYQYNDKIARHLPWTDAAKLDDLNNPTVNQIAGYAHGNDELATALTSILSYDGKKDFPMANRSTEKAPREAVAHVFVEGESTGRDLDKVKAQDLARLAQAPGRVGQARFDERATAPFNPSEKIWFKPAVTVGGMAVGVAVLAAVGTVSAMALTGVAIGTGMTVSKWSKADATAGKTIMGIATLVSTPLLLSHFAGSLPSFLTMALPITISTAASVITTGALWLGVKYPGQAILNRVAASNELRGKAQAVLAGEKKATPMMREALENIEQEKSEAMNSDEKATLNKLEAELKALNGAEKKDDQKISEKKQEIADFKEQMEKQHPVEGFTLGRMIGQIEKDSDIKKDARPEVLKSLLMKFGLEEKEADAIVAHYQNNDSELAALKNKEVSELKENSSQEDLISAVVRFEDQLDPEESITMEAVSSFAWAPDPQQNEEMKAQAVNFYAGEDLTAENRSDLASLSNLRFLGQQTNEVEAVRTDSPRTNLIKSDWSLLRKSGVLAARAEVISQRWPDSPLAKASKEVAQKQAATLNDIKQILIDAKVKPEDVKLFEAAVVRTAQFDSADTSVGQPVHEALNSIQKFSSVAQAPMVAQAVYRVKAELEKNYYSPTALTAAVRSNDLAEADVQTLVQVAGLEMPTSQIVKATEQPTSKNTVARSPREIKPLGDKVQLDRMLRTKPNAGEKFNSLIQMVSDHGENLKQPLMSYQNIGGPSSFLVAVKAPLEQMLQNTAPSSEERQPNIALATSKDGQLMGIWVKREDGRWVGVDMYGNGIEDRKLAKWDSFDASFEQSTDKKFYYWNSEKLVLQVPLKVDSNKTEAQAPVEPENNSQTPSNNSRQPGSVLQASNSSLPRIAAIVAAGLLAWPMIASAQVVGSQPQILDTGLTVVQSWFPQMGMGLVLASALGLLLTVGFVQPSVGPSSTPSPLNISDVNQLADTATPAVYTFNNPTGEKRTADYSDLIQPRKSEIVIDGYESAPTVIEQQDSIGNVKYLHGPDLRLIPVGGSQVKESILTHIAVELSHVNDVEAPQLSQAPDSRAVRAISKINNDPEMKKAVGQIVVGALFDKKMIEEAKQLFGVTVTAKTTMADLENTSQDFKEQLAHVLAYHGQSVVTKTSSMVVERTVQNLSDNMKVTLRLAHRHLGTSIMPSIRDRMNAVQDAADGRPQLGIIFSDNAVALHGLESMLTIKKGKTTRAKLDRAPVQSFDLKVIKGSKEAAQFQPQIASVTLDMMEELLSTMTQYKMTPQQARQAFDLVEAVTFGLVTKNNIETYMTEFKTDDRIPNLIVDIGTNLRTQMLAAGRVPTQPKGLIKSSMLPSAQVFLSRLAQLFRAKNNPEKILNRTAINNSQILFIPWKRLAGRAQEIEDISDRIRSTNGREDVVVLANESEYAEAQALLGPLGILVVHIQAVLETERPAEETALEAYSRHYLRTSRVRLWSAEEDFTALADLITPLAGDKAAVARFLFISMTGDMSTVMDKIFLSGITARHA